MKDASTNGITRRRFLISGAGAVIATSYAAKTGLSMPLSAKFPLPNPKAAAYICPPCGEPCDKLTFDAPGTCPHCGMTLIAADGKEAPPTVAILLFNGAELIDFAGPWEVFGTAGYLVQTVAEKPDPMTMVFGQKVLADYTFDMSPTPDILLVPGGGVFDHLKNEVRPSADDKGKFVLAVNISRHEESGHKRLICETNQVNLQP
jgi:hypothetical protein